MASKALSPLKAKPLRTPGQSLDEQIQKILDDDVAAYYWTAAAFVLLAIMEWFGYARDIPRQPWTYTFVAVASVVLLTWKFIPLRRRVRALRLGRDGERAVAEVLERLRERGARVFHDIPGDDFNLDHVVICDRGIVVVETKTLSKPYPKATISIKDGEIFAAGQKIERNPLQQVRAQCAWLARTLEESTGRRFPVRGVVGFPGWFVEPLPESERRDVWILEPKAIAAFVANEPEQMSAEQVAMASLHLSRYIRAELAD